MPVLDKEELEIEANNKLSMIFSHENAAEMESGHLEYSDYSACSFCVT